jgi:hypothetical protein
MMTITMTKSMKPERLVGQWAQILLSLQLLTSGSPWWYADGGVQRSRGN